MKKRILACLLALVMLVGLLPATVLAEDATVTTNAELIAAVSSVAPGGSATIYLGEGAFTLYNQKCAEGKTLTFIGAGADKTKWVIGSETPDPDKAGTEYNSDYSFKGANVTFENMALHSYYKKGDKSISNYLGFAHSDVTKVVNCTLYGRTTYWGYTSATFENSTFYCPDGDYALWDYSSHTMTFDGCTFIGENSAKIVNVDVDGRNSSEPEGPRVINFKDCTVNSQGGSSMKSVLNIHDAHAIPEADIKKRIPATDFVVYFTGNNKVTGLDANSNTCSRLFQVEIVDGGIYDLWKDTYGVTVYIGGEKVWENGKRVKHNMDITAGSYENGVAEGSENKYTDGYKDNAFDILKATDWAQQPDGSYERKVTRKCKYCGYTEIVKEVKKDDIVDIIPVILPAISKNETAPKLNTRDHFAYVQGYPDGTVKPAGSITRAEVAAILFRLMDADSRSLYYSTASGFRDVDSTKWYNTYVATLNNAGVITDSRTGYFRPNDAITRAELAAMLAQFAEKKSAAIYFSDVSAGYWAANAIALTANLGWINGYPDGTFGPDKTVTRAELMAMVNRATGRAPKSAGALLSGMKTWKDNADTARWYYLDVQEATNSHTYLGAPTETWTSLTATPDWSQYE